MSPLSKNARIAGLLYLTLMTAPLRLIYIPSKLFVSGNASATANNIAAHETLFRLGILSDLFTATMGIFLTLALYRLFKGADVAGHQVVPRSPRYNRETTWVSSLATS